MSDEWKAPRVVFLAPGAECACGERSCEYPSPPFCEVCERECIEVAVAGHGTLLCAACVTHLNGQFQEHARAR